MYRHIVVIALMLFAITPVVLADQHTTQDQQISQSNRFLSAEVQRAIRDEMDIVQEDLQTYQDENFAILDNRISTFIEDSQWKIGLVGAGAGFIAMGLGALLMMRSFKKHSIAQARRSEQEMEQIVQQVQDRVREELDAYTQPEWRPQEPARTMSTEYGQAGAERMSQMNQWQAQSAYQDSWKAPVEVEKEVRSTDNLQKRYQQENPEWEQPPTQDEYYQDDYYDEQGYGEDGYDEGYDEDYSGIEQWAEDLLNKEDDEGWL